VVAVIIIIVKDEIKSQCCYDSGTIFGLGLLLCKVKL